MSKDKITRKELLKKDDAFLAAAGQGAKWISTNRIQVIVGATVVVAVIAGTWAVVETMHRRDERASVLFQRGLELLGGQVLPPGSEETPDPEATTPTFADEKQKNEAVRAQFEKVRAEGGGSRVAALAGFFVADLSEKLGEKEKAEAQFGELASELAPTDNLYFLAVERAAYLQETRGDLDGALKALAKLANVEKGFYSDFATFHQARLYLDKGETERARNLLERIDRDFATSPVAEAARERLAGLAPKPPAEAPPAGDAPPPEAPAPPAPGSTP